MRLEATLEPSCGRRTFLFEGDWCVPLVSATLKEMDSRVLRHFGCLLLFSMAVPPSAFAELNLSLDCSIRSVSTPGLASRGRVIRFPDGREITLIGQNHGSRTGYQDIESLIDDAKRETNPKFLASLTYKVNPVSDSTEDDAEILKDEAVVRERSREANQETAFLQSYLTSSAHSNAKYVGIEGSPAAVSTQIEVMKRLRAKIHDEFSRRQIRNPALEAAILKSRFGATFYLRETEPGIFKDRKFLGYVSEKESEKIASSLAKLAEVRRVLASERTDAFVMTLDKIFEPYDLSNVSEAYSDQGYGGYNPEKDEARLRTRLLANFKPADRAVVLPYFDAKLALLKTAKLRDRSDAQTLVDQPSSGVMFVGRAHLESVATLLRTTCLEKLDRTGKPAGAPSAAKSAGSAH